MPRSARRHVATCLTGLGCAVALAVSPLSPVAHARVPGDGADGLKSPVAVQEQTRKTGADQRRKRLAKRLAPMVWLAKGDDAGPMSAHTFIDYSELVWAHDTGCEDHTVDSTPSERAMGDGRYRERDAAGPVAWPPCEHHNGYFYSNENTRPMASGGPPGEEGFFLDMKNSMHKGGGTGSPVYVQRYPRAIMYWFLYGYNDGPASFNHEGDWERIAVRLTKKNKPFKVVFWRHGKPCYVRWKNVRKYKGHPVVFSASGTHASYARKGRHKVDVPYLPDFYDRTSKGKRWKTWRNLDRVRKQPWWGYGGGWGEVGETKHTTGPTGPAPFRDDGGLHTTKRC